MNSHSIFSYNNPLTQFLVKLLKLLWLNILWLVTSLPLVTAGASTCALYYTTMRLAREEEGYLTRDFFSSFKCSFKKATFFFFFIVGVTAVCAVDFFYLGNSQNLLLRLLAFFIAGVLLAFSFAAVYLLPLTAQFENSVPGTFQAALGLVNKNPHWSFCLVILNLLLPLVILFRFLPLIIFGPALPVFFQAYLLNRIFKKYVPGGTFLPGSPIKREGKS
ncbi:YesL family protein [Lacrimispora sp. JR3]|uniref:YesL family protein n=1 Tax=Lacrimispora sinapis TaxID=3111456 RepID=UPI00374A82E3